ncbi:WD repeat-containing protein 37 [Trichostrongylus colubriformis]|uniref:WD repeat-containing protein 37 n=2 Tax=Trichostrongylus colubriformis TaxID=6319 RepID=A0AAN8ENH1_TRICO
MSSHRPTNTPRLRTNTDAELLAPVDYDAGDTTAPHRARLYHLFGMIDKEFDALFAENCALRAKIEALEAGTDGDATVLQSESFNAANEIMKGGGRKAMHVGQKLRTALRGPPGRLVFKVGGSDGERFRLTRRFEGHRDGVWHVTADATRSICASASADQTARIWSLNSGACLYTYTGHSGSVNCVAFAPLPESQSGGELTVATSSGDESAHIWKVTLGQHAVLSSDDDEDEKAPVDSGGGEGDTAPPSSSEGHRVKNALMRLTGHTGVVIGCDWLAGGNQLITASWDRTANIYDVERGEVLNILSGHEMELNHCSAHPNQKLVVTSSKDSTFRLWDFRETIQSVAVFQGHQDSVSSVAFSSGDRIVSGSDDRTVKVWDLRNMRSAISTIRLSSAANRLSVSRTHGAIAIPLDNRHVRIYDLAGNRLPRVPNRRCHSRMVSCAAWADDHPHCNLLTCGFDRGVAGWKVTLAKD